MQHVNNVIFSEFKIIVLLFLDVWKTNTALSERMERPK